MANAGEQEKQEQPPRIRDPSIGDKLPTDKECPSCGEMVKQTARVCRHCGYRFERGWVPHLRKGYAMLGGALAVLGTLVSIWAAVFRGESKDPSERVQACMRAHGLDRARVVTTSRDTTIFAFCSWPAPDYADADGYTEVRATSVDRSLLPNTGDTSEASGASVADRIKLHACKEAAAVYTFGSQGDFSHQRLLVQPGDVTTVYGEPWRNRPDENVFLGFYPDDDEAVILRTLDHGLDSVRCVA